MIFLFTYVIDTEQCHHLCLYWCLCTHKHMEKVTRSFRGRMEDVFINIKTTKHLLICTYKLPLSLKASESHSENW